jgi:hypothetical protein
MISVNVLEKIKHLEPLLEIQLWIVLYLAYYPSSFMIIFAKNVGMPF